MPAQMTFALHKDAGGWKIGLKQINLIDGDEGQENNSFFL